MATRRGRRIKSTNAVSHNKIIIVSHGLTIIILGFGLIRKQNIVTKNVTGGGRGIGIPLKKYYVHAYVWLQYKYLPTCTFRNKCNGRGKVMSTKEVFFSERRDEEDEFFISGAVVIDFFKCTSSFMVLWIVPNVCFNLFNNHFFSVLA